jgi:cephalosporin-C deacetylase-like acetyl esterase
VGSDFICLRQGGNQAGGLVHFPDADKAVFASVQENISPEEFALEYRLEVLDHYVAGKAVAQDERAATLKPGMKAEMTWKLPALPPGFYYLTLAAFRGGEKLTSTSVTFTVDLPHYTHPLTRPADFRAFWDAKLKALRALPFNDKLTEVAERSTDAAVHYSLELTVAGGATVKTTLQVPRKAGQYVGRFGANDKATDGDAVLIGYPMPETATFTRWTSRDDNNMLDCYLLAVRLTDYLRSRPEVGRIYLFGASRTGPIQFANAALDPTRVAAVDIHVPTSAGIGWTDKPYYGWGVPNGYDPKDAEQVAHFAAMAAYFDPVNFAPDLKVPVIMAYGIGDDLARPQGIEAMYQLAASPWKRISRDPGGHQYSPGFQQLQKDLAAYLQTATGAGADEKILKEH